MGTPSRGHGAPHSPPRSSTILSGGMNITCVKARDVCVVVHTDTHTPARARGHGTRVKCARLLPAWVRAPPRPRISLLTRCRQKPLSAPADQGAPEKRMKWAEGKTK